MRRYLALLVLLVLFSVTPNVQAVSPCTIRGTNGNDTLYGTSYSDFICAFGGNDYANGRQADDVVRGGLGNDTVVGGTGADVLRGRRGNDHLFGIDSHPNDQLFGGLGNDQCYIDLGDHVNNCENIHVSKPLLKLNLIMIQLTPALQQWMNGHGYGKGDDDGARR